MNAKLGQSGFRQRPHRCSGLTLIEQAVVVAAIAMLVALSLPAVRSFIKSIEARGGSKAMINAALAAARATAAQQQRYAGIRFQHAYDPNNSSPKTPQYMIFIVQDPNLFRNGGFKAIYGFRAVEGLQPIKLPDTVGVMEVVDNDVDIDTDSELADRTTFSVVFSPSGKLVIHNVQALRKNNNDTIFNNPLSSVNLMFEDDYYNALPFRIEQSKNSFRIYDRDIFSRIDSGQRCTGYLSSLEVIYINPYTGTMINR